VDEGRTFVQGMTVPFQVRVTALANDLRNVKIEVSTRLLAAGGTYTGRRDFWKLGAGRTRSAAIDFLPPGDLQGLKTFDWGVSYETGGRQYCFETQSEHTVYPANENPRQVIDKVIFNITQGHAGTVEARDFYRDLSRQRDLSLRELVDRARSAPSVWRPLPLYEAGEGRVLLPESAAPAEARTDRLTLHVGSQRVHLLAAPELRLGKNRQCDVVTRIFNPDGTADRDKNSRIGRRHCSVRLEGEQCLVVDGGYYPELGRRKPSAWGTFLDQAPVRQNEQAALPVNRDFLLSLAGTDPAEETVFAFGGRLLTCELWNQPDCPFPNTCSPSVLSCLILRRSDHVDEAFAVVWNHCPMQFVEPSLQGLRVWRRPEAFAYRVGDDCGWLAPGSTIPLPGGPEVRVETYGQAGL